MIFDDVPALIGGYAYLAKLTHKSVDAVVWIARRVETLVDQDWSTHGIRRLIRDDLEAKPWQW